MRGFAGFIGTMMVVAGLASLLVGLLWTDGVHRRTSSRSHQAGWTCGPGSEPNTQACLFTEVSPIDQAADSAAGTAWLDVGVGLTIGGAVLAGAVVASAGRPRQATSQQMQQAPQQMQQAPQTGPFVPQPNYGQQPRA